MTDSLEARQAQLKTIAAEIAACQQCPLHKARTQTVPGSGPASATIMFIGEAPGFHEDQQGLPFVGASGKYLEQLLADVNLRREDVFITNVVKCRPPENREPLQPELDACADYLNRQIELIDPKIVITLGRFSMAKYFPDGRISKIHGQAKRMGGRIYYPMYHPAAVLRTPSLRPEMEADMQRVLKLMQDTGSDDLPDADEPQVPKQLSLF
jgi:uracil-DNA glycosylase family 4